MSKLEIRNCGKGPRVRPTMKDATARAKVRFLFECPVDESALTDTDMPGVKHCGECDRRVYRCDTIEQAEEHAVAGKCIAVPSELAIEAGERAIASFTIRGMPQPREMWAEKLFSDQ